MTSARPPLTGAAVSVILIADRLPGDDQSGVLDAWQSALVALDRPFEILLVRPLAAGEAAESPRIFGYEPAQGLVTALRQAIAASQYPVIVMSTWDGQYQAADVRGLLASLDVADVVVGYRAGQPVPLWRRLLDRLLGLATRIVLGSPREPRRAWLGRLGRRRRWLARWAFGLRLTDPECPFRAYRREVLLRIPLQSRGSFVHVELLAKSNHMECLLAEEPVRWSPPTQPSLEADTFSEDARLLFRQPDFGASEIEPAP